MDKVSPCSLSFVLLMAELTYINIFFFLAANNIEDDEDKLQERLAKRFAKRARMNRLLDLHAGDKEFSQSRLLDEDEDLKRELTKIKVSQVL